MSEDKNKNIIKEHLLKLADAFDNINKEGLADSVANIIAKVATEESEGDENLADDPRWSQREIDWNDPTSIEIGLRKGLVGAGVPASWVGAPEKPKAVTNMKEVPIKSAPNAPPTSDTALPSERTKKP